MRALFDRGARVSGPGAFGHSAARAPSTADWIAFAVVAALGLWTIPVMLFPLGAVALWLALSFALTAAKRT